MFGGEYLERLRTTGPLNAGVFAGRMDAPHWQAWRRMIEVNIHKANSSRLLFSLDQTALSIVCWQGGFETALLPATCNWLTDHALPMASDDSAILLRPLPPHEPLGVVHQTDYTKRAFFPLSRPGGGSLSRTLSYQHIRNWRRTNTFRLVCRWFSRTSAFLIWCGVTNPRRTGAICDAACLTLGWWIVACPPGGSSTVMRFTSSTI